MTMVKHVAVLLADGFEEGEAVIFIDMMRRLEIKVDVLSCMETTALNSYFETKISADYTLAEKFEQIYDAIMMPGGPQGTDYLSKNSKVIEFVKRHIKEKKYICALCSSSAKVLAANGLLEGRNYATGDGLSEHFLDGNYLDKKVVVDGSFITGKGLGVSFEFSLTVGKILLTDNSALVDFLAEHIYFDHWPLLR